MKPIDYDLLTVDQFKAAIAELNREAESIPLPEGEEFFDALEDFRGPEIELDYTPEQDAAYERYLAKRQAKKQPKPRDIAEMKSEAYAKLVEFYNNEDNIVNERSPFDEE